MPTYPAGSIGYLVVSTAGSAKKPARPITIQENETLNYYNEESHTASFALPQFVKKGLE